jgi:hypothetical protein
MPTEKLPSQTEVEPANTNTTALCLLGALSRSEDYRHAFVEEAIRTRLAAQIKSMRENRPNPWDYRQFAEKLGKKVSWAYRLEDPNEAIPTVPTLLQVAMAFDVALDVRFVQFSDLLRDVTDLSPDSFAVSGFSHELPAMKQMFSDIDLRDPNKVVTFPGTAKGQTAVTRAMDTPGPEQISTDKSTMTRKPATSAGDFSYLNSELKGGIINV